MHIEGSGRFVFVAQWVAAVLLPAFVFLGRGLVGAEIGWLSVFGLVYGPIVLLVLLMPPILTLFDREARRARATRVAYDVASAILWLALLVVGLTIPDAGDGGELNTVFMTWFGMPASTSTVFFAVAGTVAALAWLAAVVLAIMGVARGREAASGT